MGARTSVSGTVSPSRNSVRARTGSKGGTGRSGPRAEDGLAWPEREHDLAQRERMRVGGDLGVEARELGHPLQPALEETLRDVARFQPSAEKQQILEPDPGPLLASAGESTVR